MGDACTLLIVYASAGLVWICLTASPASLAALASLQAAFTKPELGRDFVRRRRQVKKIVHLLIVLLSPGSAVLQAAFATLEIERDDLVASLAYQDDALKGLEQAKHELEEQVGQKVRPVDCQSRGRCCQRLEQARDELAEQVGQLALSVHCFPALC